VDRSQPLDDVMIAIGAFTESYNKEPLMQRHGYRIPPPLTPAARSLF